MVDRTSISTWFILTAFPLLLFFSFFSTNAYAEPQKCLLKDEKAALDTFMSDWRTYLFTQTYPEVRNPIFDTYSELAKLPVCENMKDFVKKPLLIDTYTGAMASTAPDLREMEKIYNEEGFGSHVLREWLFRNYVLPFPDELKTVKTPKESKEEEIISSETIAENLVENQKISYGKGIPNWIQSLFIFYNQQQISKNEIIEALKFLIDNNIISTNSISIQPLESNKFQFQEKDCIAGETYDKLEKTCLLQCDNEEECKSLEEKIKTKASSIWNSGNILPNRTEYKRITFGQGIIDYEVKADDIKEIFRYPVSSGMQKWQDDADKHKEVWKSVLRFIPKQYRSNITYFSLGTDDVKGLYAFVDRDPDELSKWILAFDIKDAYSMGLLNDQNLTYSLIHEFGHIPTLDSTQVDIDKELYSPYLSDYQYEKLFDQKEKKCQPRYMTWDGCTKKYSYINLFFQEFWNKTYSEVKSIEKIEDNDERYDKTEEFYLNHKDDFVTYYATSNPDEDIAESWTAFVLKDKPEPNTIADKKILFFYDYPEFVKLREFMRNRL